MKDEALAEQPAQQKPVGTYGEIFESMRSLLRSGRQADQQIYMAMQHKPLYTSPPAQPAPVQEPVGYVAENGVVDWNVCAPPILTDLYTTPPNVATPLAAQRPWVGLKDEEIEKACVPLGAAMLSFTEVARAIEAKLKERNT
jgi:hypothetical protein